MFVDTPRSGCTGVVEISCPTFSWSFSKECELFTHISFQRAPQISHNELNGWSRGPQSSTYDSFGEHFIWCNHRIVRSVFIILHKMPVRFFFTICLSKKGDIISHNVWDWLFHENHGPSYPPRTNFTANPNFYVMLWHFMNSMRISCDPVSVIMAVYATT
jgi:hypothetical protein